jgi:hypothetical protein
MRRLSEPADSIAEEAMLEERDHAVVLAGWGGASDTSVHAHTILRRELARPRDRLTHAIYGVNDGLRVFGTEWRTAGARSSWPPGSPEPSRARSMGAGALAQITTRGYESVARSGPRSLKIPTRRCLSSLLFTS